MGDVKAVPEGMHTITPTLAVEGAAEFIDFAKKAFGAAETSRAMDPSGKKVWHAALRIGDSALFVADADPGMNPVYAARLWLYVEDVDQWYARAVAAGAKATMAPVDMFWGDRYGRVTDAWGNEWGLAQHTKDMSPAEMQAAQDAFVKGMAEGK